MLAGCRRFITLSDINGILIEKISTVVYWVTLLFKIYGKLFIVLGENVLCVLYMQHEIIQLISVNIWKNNFV